MDENGNHVTWRELNLALEPIKEDVVEIKGDVKAIRDQSGDTWFGPKTRNLTATLVSGVLLTVFSTGLSLLVIYLT